MEVEGNHSRMDQSRHKADFRLMISLENRRAFFKLDQAGQNDEVLDYVQAKIKTWNGIGAAPWATPGRSLEAMLNADPRLRMTMIR